MLIKKHLLNIILSIACFSFTAFSQDDAIPGQTLYSSNFIIDDIQRNFTYYLPLDYGNNEKYSLIIFLHDKGEIGKSLIKNYGDAIHVKADTSGCIIIYPDAFNDHWNYASGSSDTVSDVTFFSLLIDYFIEVYHGDEKRVYISGFSNGAEMANRLRCVMPARITAIAPFVTFSESTVGNCASGAAVAVINTEFQKGTKPDSIAIRNSIDSLLEHTKK